MGVPEAQLTGLQRVQNSAARPVTHKRKFEHVTPILRSLHWLPIRARIQFKVLILVFKCLHGNAPAYLSELIKQYHPCRNLRSQSKNLLSEIHVKSKAFGDLDLLKKWHQNYGITSPKTLDPLQTLINLNP